MGFDGQNYGSASFVFPSTYHPGSPFSGVALSTTLSNLYFLGRTQSQVVFQQCYGWNGIDPEVNANAAGLSIIAAIHTEIAHGFARIPAEATFLRCFVTFAGMPLGDAVANHSLSIIGGPAGTTIETSVPAATTYDSHLSLAQGILAPNWIPSASPAGGVDPAMHVADFGVSLAIVDLDDDVEFSVKGCIVGDVATAYRPMFCSVWWEVE